MENNLIIKIFESFYLFACICNTNDIHLQRIKTVTTMKNQENNNKEQSESKYITPSKDNPIFQAHCDNFGNIEDSPYKEWQIKNEDIWIGGKTFSTSFKDSVNRLHEWIEENEWCLKEDPKCKFTIEVTYGKYNKFGDIEWKNVYKISANKAKKLL